MIELHCHLLPGIDDGPEDLEASVELARRLVADGVHAAAATPHVRDDHPRVVPTEIGSRCEELRARLAEEGIPLDVLPGGELDLVRTMEISDEELRLVSYGQRGTDLLLESPYGGLSSNFEDLVHNLQLRGYRVLLAHPERNPTFREDTKRLKELVHRGVLLQVTAMSLALPERSSRSARSARKLVREGLAHVIASDAHGRSSIDRASLSEGVEEARSLVGERADWMVTDVPAAILGGEPLPEGPEPKRRSGLRRRFSVR